MGPLRLDDRGVIAELREVLRAAGLDGNGVREALGVSSELLTRSQDVPVRERRLAGNEPLGTLIKLFVLDLPVAAEAAKGSLGRSPWHSSSSSACSRPTGVRCGRASGSCRTTRS